MCVVFFNVYVLKIQRKYRQDRLSIKAKLPETVQDIRLLKYFNRTCFWILSFNSKENCGKIISRSYDKTFCWNLNSHQSTPKRLIQFMVYIFRMVILNNTLLAYTNINYFLNLFRNFNFSNTVTLLCCI